jgi:hypothetical protein
VFGAEVRANAIQSVAPPNPPVSVTVTFCPVAAEVVLTDSVGGAAIVSASDADVPPPGGGVVTDTCALPTAATSADGIVAASCVLLRNVVARGLPFQFTTDADVKPDPFTVSVNPAPPATVLDGDSEVATGTGGGTNTTVTVGVVAAIV